jgi:hypothetical protein
MKLKTKNGLSRLLLPIFLFALLAGSFAGNQMVRAEGATQFGIRPANSPADGASRGYFILKSQPGQTLHDSVVIANLGDAPIQLRVYPVDAITSQHSGVSYQTINDPHTGVSQWITLEKSEVEIPSKKQVTIGFSVTIPQNTISGQHVGGIAVEPKTVEQQVAKPTGSSIGVTTVTRALTAVQVNVGSDKDNLAFQIGGAQMSTVEGLPTLTLQLQNQGNVMVKPAGTVTMTDASGKTVLNQKLALDTLLPQSSISYPVQAEPPSLPGTYKVAASLDFGSGAPAVYQGEVTVQAQIIPSNQSQPGRARTGQVAAVADTAASVQSSPSQPDQAGLLVGFGVASGVLLLTTLGLVGMLMLSKKKRTR